MSTTYRAYVIFGVKLHDSDLVIKTPDPLWGVHKFNPESGEKVERFITKKIYADPIVEGLSDETDVYEYPVYCPQEDSVFLGHVLREVGGYSDPQSAVIPEYSADERNNIVQALLPRLKQFLPHLTFTEKDFKMYVVMYVG